MCSGYTTRCAFDAVKGDGSVITWGSNTHGGDSSALKDALASGVQQVYSTDGAFAAVKNDSSVITWGHDDAGGDSS